MKWSELSDKGGHEYDSQQEAIVIKPLRSALPAGLVEVFAGWFGKLKQGITLRCAYNQGLS
jgi:hypothetical protein